MCEACHRVVCDKSVCRPDKYRECVLWHMMYVNAVKDTNTFSRKSTCDYVLGCICNAPVLVTAFVARCLWNSLITLMVMK